MANNNDTLAMLTSLIQMVSYKLRTAVTYLLGDGNTSIVAATVFEDLLRCYYSFYTKHNNLYEKFDGYMTKSVMDIHNDTLAGLKSIKSVLLKLKGAGLIDFRTGGFNNTTAIKIADDAVSRIENAYEEFAELREEHIASKREALVRKRKEAASKEASLKEDSKEAKKYGTPNILKTPVRDNTGLDYDSINEVLEDADIVEDYAKLNPLIEDFESLKLIYAFSKYYKEYTGEAYKWNAVKFNTLNKEWKKYSLYKGAEIGLTIALKKELNRDPKSFGGKQPLEKRIAYSFNKDAKLSDLMEWKASNEGYEGVVYYNLLKY